MFIKSLILFLALISLSACLPSETTSATVITCDNIVGTYSLGSLKCDGVAKTISSTNVYTISDNSVVSKFDGGSCALEINWSKAGGDNAFNLTGKNNVVCYNNGTSTSSCSDSSITCATSVSVDGVENFFSSCTASESGASLTIKRTVTSAQVSAQMSDCSAGEEEVVTFSKQ